MIETSSAVPACRTVLLDDLPADRDAFGPHQRVAHAIADMIREEEGGRAIALIGSWGSGKSTVIRILSNSFRDSKNIVLFTFDAWAHRGDPLRRSFLEQLGRTIRGWATVEAQREWDLAFDQLSRRRDDVETTTRPALSGWGALLAVAMLLVPVGSALLDSGLMGRNRLLGDPRILTAMLPVLIVLAAWLCTRDFRLLRRKSFWTFWIAKRHSWENESLLGLFVNRVKETVRTTAIRTP